MNSQDLKRETSTSNIWKLYFLRFIYSFKITWAALNAPMGTIGSGKIATDTTDKLCVPLIGI